MLRKHIKKLWENMEFVQFIVNLLDRSKRYYQNRCHLIFNDIFLIFKSNFKFNEVYNNEVIKIWKKSYYIFHFIIALLCFI